MNGNKMVRFREPVSESNSDYEHELEQEQEHKKVYPKKCNIKIGNTKYYVEDKINAVLDRIETNSLETQTKIHIFFIVAIFVGMQVKKSICNNPIFNLCDENSSKLLNNIMIGVIVLLAALSIKNIVNIYQINSKFYSECN